MSEFGLEKKYRTLFVGCFSTHHLLQVQPRQHALEHAVYVAPTPQRELDHTDQGYICPEKS